MQRLTARRASPEGSTPGDPIRRCSPGKGHAISCGLRLVLDHLGSSECINITLLDHQALCRRWAGDSHVMCYSCRPVMLALKKRPLGLKFVATRGLGCKIRKKGPELKSQRRGEGGEGRERTRDYGVWSAVPRFLCE